MDMFIHSWGTDAEKKEMSPACLWTMHESVVSVHSPCRDRPVSKNDSVLPLHFMLPSHWTLAFNLFRMCDVHWDCLLLGIIRTSFRSLLPFFFFFAVVCWKLCSISEPAKLLNPEPCVHNFIIVCSENWSQCWMEKFYCRSVTWW